MTRASALIFHFSKEIKIIENDDEFSGCLEDIWSKGGKGGWNLRNQVAANMVIFILQFERNRITVNDQIRAHFQIYASYLINDPSLLLK